MSTSLKVIFLALGLMSITSACSPVEATSTVTTMPAVGGETPVLTAIPKQNDLIFVEFFSGT